MTLLVYGLMRPGDCPDDLEVDSHGGTTSVRCVAGDEIAALVADAGAGPVRVRRETLMAHSDVLQRAVEHGPVLPMRFGVALADEEAVRRELLEPNGARLAARLEALDGCAELQVKATFDQERVLKALMASDRTLAAMAARVRASPGPAGHFDRIRLGELIAEAIEARASAATEAVVGALQPLALSVSVGARQHEWMALNVAFLIDRARRKDFDARVDRLSADYGGELQFRLIGPMPPHSFAEYEWEAGATWA